MPDRDPTPGGARAPRPGGAAPDAAVSPRPGSGRLRPLVGFLAGLTFFLCLGAFLEVRLQRQVLLEQMERHLSHELGLFEAVIRPDLLAREIAAVQRSATAFGGRFRDVVRIAIEDSDGVVLARYERPDPSTAVSRQRHTFAYAAGRSVAVSLDHDLSALREQLRTMTLRIVLASVLFAAAAGTFLWHLLRRIAFAPLERAVAELNLANERLGRQVAEQTGDLVQANTALRLEVAVRRSALRELTVKDQAIRSSITGIAISDLAGTITYANPAMAAMWGYAAPAELQGLDATGFWEPPAAATAVLAALRDEGKWQGELTGRHRDGRLIDVSLQASIVRDNGGQPIGMMGSFLDVTGRKAADEATRQALRWAHEEKSKSEAILAAIGDGISIQDADYRIRYQNARHKSLFGDRRGEYCYRAYEGREALCEGCPVALSLRDGGVHTCERTGTSERGPLHVEITASALRDAAGNIAAGIEVVRDVSERVRVQRELRESNEVQAVLNALLSLPVTGRPLETIAEEALSTILSCSRYAAHPSGALFILDQDSGDYLLRAQRGLHPEARAACGRVSPGSCPCAQAALSREVQFAATPDESRGRGFLASAAHGHFSVPIVMAGAALGVLEIFFERGRPRDPSEESFLAAVAASLAGIIQRKHLEQGQERMILDLRALLDTVSDARREWHETFDSIADMISIHDGGRTVLRANRAFARHFGWEPQQIVGRGWPELDPAGRDPLLADLAAQTPFPDGTESREVFDPGTAKVFSVATFPLTLRGGASRGFVHVAREITEEREREMRLIMSERLASLGQMAAGIAHEINNPLATIAGCVDGMARRVSRGQFDPELFARYLTIVRDELARSKEITTSMLSLVRGSSFESKRLDIHRVIRSALEIIGYQGRLRMVAVETSLAAGAPAVLGSEGELKQVLLIVLTNALDAMEDHGGLSVTTRTEGGGLTIDVTDSGPGIPAESAGRIFEPFFTTKGVRGGTGLGLSIARRIITAHQGCIQALSAGGRGTTIQITLPLEAPTASTPGL